MRRSFGSSKGGGGNGTGGGIQMLRNFQRAIRAGGSGGAQEHFSQSGTGERLRRGKQSSFNNNNDNNNNNLSNNNLTISSSSAGASSQTPPFNLPISAATSSPPSTWPPACSSPETDWELIDGIEDDRDNALSDDFVFGSVPSRDEVLYAVHSLQGAVDPVSSAYCIKNRAAYNLDEEMSDQGSSPTGFAHRVSSSGSKLDWLEPSMQLYHSNMLLPHHGSDRAYDAFHMLTNEPSVQRMVISLSSDRAVWDAVLNNDVVRELRESLNQAGESPSEESDKASEASESSDSGDLFSWLITNVKAKIMELINNLTKMVNELFHQEGSNKAAEGSAASLEEKLRASFMLSMVVLLIVVLNRADKA